MNAPPPELPPEIAEALQAGMALGQNQTFALVSGRCSAAQAEALLRLRESKCYLSLAKTWKEFCPRFLQMSYSQADRIIRCWQEFGPGFFELQKLISISPETYRSIEPAIREGALHFNDEAIELDPENSRRIVAAVSEMRRSKPSRKSPPPTLDERISDLDKRCDSMLAEFAELARLNAAGGEGERFATIVTRACAALQKLQKA